MKAHDWVSVVEQPATAETVGRETQDWSGGEASPEENEKEANKKDGEQQGDELKEVEDEKKERDPTSVQVRSKQHYMTQISNTRDYFFVVCVCVCV